MHGAGDAARVLFTDIEGSSRLWEDARERMPIAQGRLDPARDMLREVIVRVEERGSRAQGQYALDVAAGLALARQGWQAGARLQGA